MRKAFLALAITTLCFKHVCAQNASPYWSLAGNSNASTSSKLGTTNAIALRLYTKNAERLRIDTLGRIGIGTTAPLQKLHVAGTGVFTGNVGIGTTSPTQKLHVVGTSLFTSTLAISNGGLSVKNTTGSLGNAALDANGSLYGITSQGGSYGVYAYSLNGTGLFGSSTNGKGVYGGGATYGVYGVGTASNGFGVYGKGATGVEGESTDGVGVVGQGSTSGVEGSSTDGPGVSGNSTNGHGIYGTGVYGVTGNSLAANAAGIQGYSSGTGGKGVYGTSEHAYGIYGSTHNASSYAGYFQGSVYSTGTYQGSDRSLKQNIEDVSSAMEIISKLQPKSYTFRQDGNYKLMNLPAGKHYGLIAQDVEKVLPDIVKATQFERRMAAIGTNDSSIKEANPVDTQTSQTIQFKALNYTELIPIVIKGMQEQEAENKALKEQVLGQQQQINELRRIVLDMKNGTNALTSTVPYLEQATPNPASGTTRIAYTLPAGSRHGQLLITDAVGKTIKTMQLNGSGSVNVNTTSLSSGTYNYTLYVDGRQVDTKRLIIAR